VGNGEAVPGVANRLGGRGGDRFDAPLALRQQINDFDALRTREGARDVRQLLKDGVFELTRSHRYSIQVIN
jgi:hypothetical protein